MKLGLKLLFCLTLCGLVLSDTYVLETTQLTYVQAKANCVSKFGGELAKVTTTAVNNFLKSLLSSSVPQAYIGLEAELPKWKWHDGSDLKTPRWDTNEPNGLRENRGELRVNGRWNDINGATKRASFCHIKGVTMYTAAGAKTWNEAEAYCEANAKGWLSSIYTAKTSAEYAAMLKTRGRTSAWFGGKQYAKFEKDPKTGWLYVDGTNVPQTNWSPNEPNQYRGSEEDCIQLYASNSKWNDLGCNGKLTAFFCDDGKVIGKTAGAPPMEEDFELVSLTSPTQTVWYNTPMFYMIMGFVMFSIVMFYHRSQNVKKDPLLPRTDYSSI